jgi:[acyl-carrier-protein] S-malonyltransferase
VELGAGRVLSGLARRTLPGLATMSLGTPAEIDAFIATLGS